MPCVMSAMRGSGAYVQCLVSCLPCVAVGRTCYALCYVCHPWSGQPGQRSRAGHVRCDAEQTSDVCERLQCSVPWSLTCRSLPSALGCACAACACVLPCPRAYTLTRLCAQRARACMPNCQRPTPFRTRVHVRRYLCGGWMWCGCSWPRLPKQVRASSCGAGTVVNCASAHSRPSGQSGCVFLNVCVCVCMLATGRASRADVCFEMCVRVCACVQQAEQTVCLAPTSAAPVCCAGHPLAPAARARHPPLLFTRHACLCSSLHPCRRVHSRCLLR